MKKKARCGLAAYMWAAAWYWGIEIMIFIVGLLLGMTIRVTW